MGLLAFVLGLIAGLCTVMSIITATDVIPPLGTEFTAMYWLVLAGVLFLAAVVTLLSRSSYE